MRPNEASKQKAARGWQHALLGPNSSAVNCIHARLSGATRLIGASGTRRARLLWRRLFT